MNRSTHFEKPEEILMEMSLLESIRLTDMTEKFDTLTVSASLADDPKKFFQIGDKLTGSEFLKTPYK
jgi:hypothetical protein